MEGVEISASNRRHLIQFGIEILIGLAVGALIAKSILYFATRG